MTILFVQHEDYSNGAGASSITTNNPKSTTAGNLNVVCVSTWSGTSGADVITSVTDTAGNTYVKAVGQYRDGSTTDERAEIWYSENISAEASNYVTANFTGSAGTRYISVSEYSGVTTSSSLDDSSYNSTSSTTSHTTGNATASETGCLSVANINTYDARNFTAGTGYTTLSADSTGVYQVSEYDILSSSGTNNAGVTTSSNTSGIFVQAIFKPLTASTINDLGINIGDEWKEYAGAKINIGDDWKTVDSIKINIGDDWKTVF